MLLDGVSYCSESWLWFFSLLEGSVYVLYLFGWFWFSDFTAMI